MPAANPRPAARSHVQSGINPIPNAARGRRSTNRTVNKIAPTAATWVNEDLADRIELKSNSVGDLAFFKGAPATV